MPTIQSPSKKAREENIRREIASGRDPRQAVAIGYAIQRRAKKKQLGVHSMPGRRRQ